MAGKVGGAAIPGGVMMVSGTHAGVAILDYLDCVHAASFETVSNPVKIPGLRGIAAIGCSLMTAAKGIVKAEKLRIGAEGADVRRYLSAAGAVAGSAVCGVLLDYAGKKCAEKNKGRLAAAGIDAVGALYPMLMLVLFASAPAGRRMRGFHGAEHKTIRCVDKGAAPIPENAYREPRIHPRCGTSLAVTAGALYLVSDTLVRPLLPERWQAAAGNALALVSLAAAYERQMKTGGGLFGKVGTWAQKFTTAEPDVAMLEAASAAIYAALEPDERS